MGPNFTLPGYSTAILTLPPHRPSPPPFSNLDPPEIDFFDVSDDFEQGKEYFFGTKIFSGLGKIFKKTKKKLKT